jgi:hypothetical protein
MMMATTLWSQSLAVKRPGRGGVFDVRRFMITVGLGRRPFLLEQHSSDGDRLSP